MPRRCGARPRTSGAGRSARRAVEGDRAGLLRWLQPLGDRGDAGSAPGHGEGTDETRFGEDSRRAGRGIGMNETEHDRRRDDIAAYLLGALEPGEAAELERHIAGCTECERELERLRPAVRVLPETVERVEAPAALRGRLMEQVRSEAAGSQATPPAARRPPRRRFGLRPLAGLATLALVLAAIGGYAISNSGSGGGPKTTTVVTGHS